MMASAAPDFSREISKPRLDRVALVAITTSIAVLHLLTNGRYGFHRDELQVLSDARHLDWGFVAYPPFTPFVERIGMNIFGISLVGLRLFSVIAQATVVVVTGKMVREFGGRLWAQATAAVAVAVAPLALFEGTEFQYTTFDYVWWVLIAYFMIRLLKSDNPRWCLAIGVVVGLGLMTKYTMAFYIAGIFLGLLLTRGRRFLASGWFWVGALLAFTIFLPNLVWQVRHDFISLHFLQHIHRRDVGQGRAEGFWTFQFFGNVNRFGAPLWIVGLFGLLRSSRYRTLAWMWAVPVAVFWLAKGRGYYTGAAYPMLIAMGTTVIEAWLARLPRFWRGTVQVAYVGALLAWAVFVTIPVVVPLAKSGPLMERALKNNGDLREEIGWHDLVRNVAAIRDSLPPEQRANIGVFVGNYGEQGAIEILGPQYHLPAPVSVTNSAWLRGYPASPPSMLIIVGNSREYVERVFTSCRLAGHNTNSYAVENEESKDHPDIFLCGPPRIPWPELWARDQRFG